MKGLVLMRVVQYRLRFEPIGELEAALTALRLYSEEERRDLPPYIVKTHSGKLFIRSSADLQPLVSQLCSKGRNSYLEDFILQPFLIPNGRKAQRVEVSWDSCKGTALLLRQSLVQMSVNHSPSLLLSDQAEIAPAKSSIRTEHLENTLFLVKNIIEKAAFRGKKVVVTDLHITMMQDCHKLWYFISLESFQIAHSVQKPKARLNSPIPALSTTLSPKSPHFPSSHQLQSIPTCASESLQRSNYLLLSPRSPQSVHYPKAYLQQLEVEQEVSKLLPKDNSPIANVTYSAWKQRTEGSGRLLLVDRMYARAICKQRRFVRREVQTTLKELRELREKIAFEGEEALFKAEMEARISGSVTNTENTDLAQFTRFAKARRQKLERTKSLRMQKDGIARVFEDSLQQYSTMMARVHATKLAALSTSANI